MSDVKWDKKELEQQPLYSSAKHSHTDEHAASLSHPQEIIKNPTVSLEHDSAESTSDNKNASTSTDKEDCSIVNNEKRPSIAKSAEKDVDIQTTTSAEAARNESRDISSVASQQSSGDEINSIASYQKSTQEEDLFNDSDVIDLDNINECKEYSASIENRPTVSDVSKVSSKTLSETTLAKVFDSKSSAANDLSKISNSNMFSDDESFELPPTPQMSTYHTTLGKSSLLLSVRKSAAKRKISRTKIDSDNKSKVTHSQSSSTVVQRNLVGDNNKDEVGNHRGRSDVQQENNRSSTDKLICSFTGSINSGSIKNNAFRNSCKQSNFPNIKISTEDVSNDNIIQVNLSVRDDQPLNCEDSLLAMSLSPWSSNAPLFTSFSNQNHEEEKIIGQCNDVENLHETENEFSNIELKTGSSCAHTENVSDNENDHNMTKNSDNKPNDFDASIDHYLDCNELEGLSNFGETGFIGEFSGLSEVPSTSEGNLRSITANNTGLDNDRWKKGNCRTSDSVFDEEVRDDNIADGFEDSFDVNGSNFCSQSTPAGVLPRANNVNNVSRGSVLSKKELILRKRNMYEPQLDMLSFEESVPEELLDSFSDLSIDTREGNMSRDNCSRRKSTGNDNFSRDNLLSDSQNESYNETNLSDPNCLSSIGTPVSNYVDDDGFAVPKQFSEKSSSQSKRKPLKDANHAQQNSSFIANCQGKENSSKTQQRSKTKPLKKTSSVSKMRYEDELASELDCSMNDDFTRYVSRDESFFDVSGIAPFIDVSRPRDAETDISSLPVSPSSLTLNLSEDQALETSNDMFGEESLEESVLERNISEPSTSINEVHEIVARTDLEGLDDQVSNECKNLITNHSINIVNVGADSRLLRIFIKELQERKKFSLVFNTDPAKQKKKEVPQSDNNMMNEYTNTEGFNDNAALLGVAITWNCRDVYYLDLTEESTPVSYKERMEAFRRIASYKGEDCELN